MTRPWAQTIPGTSGTRSSRIPRAAATSRAWSGPAPPKATRVKSRGSWAPLHRDGADRAHHVGDHHPDRPVRGSFHLASELACDACERPRGPVAVQGHPPAEQPSTRQPAEQQVGVGDGRGGSAPTVAGRAGVRPRALRPDLEQSIPVEPGDGAAARPDRLYVDAREPDRKAGHRTLEGDVRPQVPHQRDVRAGPAHVEGDEIAGTRAAPGIDRADHPGRRPRQGGAHGKGAGAGRRHEAAVRLVDPDAGVRHPLRESRFEARHVLVHDRLQPCVQHRGGAALELPELGLDLG